MVPFEPRSVRHKKKKVFPFDWLIVMVVAIVLSFGIRMFLYEPFDVVGPSMQPTMRSGDLVLVNKWKYRVSEPKRGEIVVFHASEEKDYIKRVIALPGETVQVKDHKLLINHQQIDEPYLPKTVQTEDFPAQTVPAGHLFVMGDNRSNSQDSRVKELGPIDQSKLIGKVVMIYWPISDWEILK